MRALADFPLSQDDRRPVSEGGVAAHPRGPRRPQRGVPSPFVETTFSIILRITMALTLVPFGIILPGIYCVIKDVVTDQYLPRCCVLKEDQRRQLQSVYPDLSSPTTINNTGCLRYLPGCVIYANERVECLKMRGRYGSNVFSLLEPRDSFTVYERKEGPGRILCKNSGISRVLTAVICILYGMLLAYCCFSIFTVLYLISMHWTPPIRGANDGSADRLAFRDNARPVDT